MGISPLSASGLPLDVVTGEFLSTMVPVLVMWLWPYQDGSKNSRISHERHPCKSIFVQHQVITRYYSLIEIAVAIITLLNECFVIVHSSYAAIGINVK